MKNQFHFGERPFKFNPQFESGEFDSESNYETHGISGCLPFTPVAVEIPGGGRIKEKKIPQNSEIVSVQGAFGKTPLHRLTAEALKALVCAARADGIKHPLLLPTGSGSGFRDPKKQEAAWKRALIRYGSEAEARKWVAKPGGSAHQSGRAIDFYLGLSNDSRNVARLRKTPAYKWLAANASRFGFYPYSREPWHWEYNPPASMKAEFSEMVGPFEFRSDFVDEYQSFEYQNESADELEFETGKKCEKNDWCSPNYIQWIQKSLNQLRKNGKGLKENGFIEKETRDAIKSFQKQFGLKPDGEVGPITEKTLISKGATPPPEVNKLSCLPTRAEILIPKINKYRGGIPLHILLGWIELESGRKNGTITSLCERGFFQIHPAEAKTHKISNHQLLSYDEDHSIQSGIKLVNNYVGRTNLLVKKYGLPNQDEMFWKLVKLHHWIPGGPKIILEDMRAYGLKPSNWAAIKNFALVPGNRKRLKQRIGFDPQQGIENADKMLEKANLWLKKIQADRTINKEDEFFFDEYESFELNGKSSNAAPKLLGKPEKHSHGESFYVQIDLGMGKNLADTGIYIPNSFRPDSETALVIYLHGHKTLYPGNKVLIKGYWDGSKFPFFALREEVAASGKNVIFVAPSLGAKSQAGNLVNKGGFDAFIKKVLASVNNHYLIPRNLRPLNDIENIILSAHSGGGSPMFKIARGTDRYAQKIKECWGFDSMYGWVAAAWLAWAKTHPKQNLYAYFGPGKGYYKDGKYIASPKDNAEVIACEAGRQNISNVCAQPSRAKTIGKVSAHFWVPKVHLKERLLKSPCAAGSVCPKKARVKK